MFIVQSKTSEDYQQAMPILSRYHVTTRVYSNDKYKESTYMQVTARTGQVDCLVLCEMAFQMNFKQDNVSICKHCNSIIECTGEGESVCGHLTFTSFIGD